MIKSIIVPLIFATLVVGIAGHGDDMKRVGRLAFKSIIYFEIVTTLALFIGLVAVNLVKPGVGVDLSGVGESRASSSRSNTPTAIGVHRAHRAAELLRGGSEERSAADRVLLDPVRRRAVAGARAAEGDHARGLRRALPR